LHADPIALLIVEIECVSILVVQNVHKGQLASVSHTAVAAVVLFQVVTKGREINSSVQLMAGGNDASLKDATSQLLAARIYVLLMEAVAAVLLRAATSQRSLLQSSVSNMEAGRSARILVVKK